ncbi:hypothetical protein ROZALSC1DRAFT_22282 [Rozella allomycis CSF55]|uniref:Uncharacterized protein n=1 Tax=Rozella allomycis (strain CSF55) TaxID=988480 RepID=A0A4P9YJ98_ROZAC|nr:hypothetical protein ROZALSC1DRAFT_22282 [Rozella allomycis CSF55]
MKISKKKSQILLALVGLLAVLLLSGFIAYKAIASNEESNSDRRSENSLKNKSNDDTDISNNLEKNFIVEKVEKNEKVENDEIKKLGKDYPVLKSGDLTSISKDIYIKLKLDDENSETLAFEGLYKGVPCISLYHNTRSLHDILNSEFWESRILAIGSMETDDVFVILKDDRWDEDKKRMLDVEEFYRKGLDKGFSLRNCKLKSSNANICSIANYEVTVGYLDDNGSKVYDLLVKNGKSEYISPIFTTLQGSFLYKEGTYFVTNAFYYLNTFEYIYPFQLQQFLLSSFHEIYPFELQQLLTPLTKIVESVESVGYSFTKLRLDMFQFEIVDANVKRVVLSDFSFLEPISKDDKDSNKNMKSLGKIFEELLTKSKKVKKVDYKEFEKLLKSMTLSKKPDYDTIYKTIEDMLKPKKSLIKRMLNI